MLIGLNLIIFFLIIIYFFLKKNKCLNVMKHSYYIYFKIVRLTAVRNGPKRTISASGELGLLQMVLESDTERCAREVRGEL